MTYILPSDFHISKLSVVLLLRFDVLLYTSNTRFCNGKVRMKEFLRCIKRSSFQEYENALKSVISKLTLLKIEFTAFLTQKNFEITLLYLLLK